MMSSVPYEVFNEFWNNLISDLSYYEVNELVAEILVKSNGFFTVCLCFALLIFLVVLIFDFLNQVTFNGFESLSRIRLRKKFKKKYTTDKPFKVHESYFGDDNSVFTVTCDKTEYPFTSFSLCKNEDNARLICLILNDDVIGKRFDIKAYTKGNNIKI